MSDEAIAIFQVEARENLELIEQGLLDLLEHLVEVEPADVPAGRGRPAPRTRRRGCLS